MTEKDPSLGWAFFGRQLGSCHLLAYNRVGVESVLSLSMVYIIERKCVYFVMIFLKENEERKYNINKKCRFYM